ncbi:MAG: hypothetical protein NT026_01320 [Candidatus Staskawiczbacteria bacterium]|nr:hypothetical protein [Candidatus Staskawiczbacteria bacterium]
MMRIFFVKNKKGVSLIIAFFIMVIILAVVFSISGLLYSEIKIIRNMGNSTISVSAADSGVEKVLYYDTKVFSTPTDASGDPIKIERGLCTMNLHDLQTNPYACTEDTSANIDSTEHSIYCNNSAPPQIADGDVASHSKGCDPGVCDDCKVSFDTAFDTASDGRKYHVDASIKPSADGKNSIFQIDSLGKYKGSSRKFKVILVIEKGEGAIVVDNDCIYPLSIPGGASISIYAHIVDVNNVAVSPVTAKIYKYSDNSLVDSIDLNCYTSNAYNTSTSCAEGQYANAFWAVTWTTGDTTPATAYYVNLEIKDTMGPPAAPGPNEKTVTKVPYCTP